MTATLIDGKAIAAALRARLKAEVETLESRHGVKPGLGVVLVGGDPASQVYVRMKGIAAREAGLHAVEIVLPESAGEADVLAAVARLNDDPAVDGFLVQFPVPSQVRQSAVIDAIDPAKDIDGLSPYNAGLLISGRQGLVPCTPYGSVLLAKHVRSSLAGLDALVIGRSILVGRPVAQLLINEDCTVTTAHSRTRDLPALCRRADILIAAIGKAGLVRGDWIKPGATVIDVGTTRLELGNGTTQLAGDVAFDEAKAVAGAITPVPGGVGPMTIACLLRNAVIACCARRGLPLPVGL